MQATVVSFESQIHSPIPSASISDIRRILFELHIPIPHLQATGTRSEKRGAKKNENRPINDGIEQL